MRDFIVRFSPLDFGLDDVGADAQGLDVVEIVEVVFEVELGEPEGDVEGGVIGGAVGRVNEGYDEVWAVGRGWGEVSRGEPGKKVEVDKQENISKTIVLSNRRDRCVQEDLLLASRRAKVINWKGSDGYRARPFGLDIL